MWLYLDSASSAERPGPHQRRDHLRLHLLHAPQRIRAQLPVCIPKSPSFALSPNSPSAPSKESTGGANSKFAGPAATSSSTRPSARSPESVRNALSLRNSTAPGAAGKPRQVPPGPGGSRRTSAPAGSLSSPTAVAARAPHAHSPAPAGAAILALVSRAPAPSSPLPGAAAAARWGGYVSDDAAADPTPNPLPASAATADPWVA
ncbi:unnamed protein product [Rangifer tarandus platyrhynchus]|uniref:Uncharacterized protein n=1 Tax=Rangifer tarandus platyrhynchus TaxID=3082113 RepID=A0AC59ZBV6_RANTA